MPSAGVKVYVGHLPERARPEEIKECFSKYGNVVNMELKGNYGFIEYEERRICEEAIESLNGTDFQGSQLRVEFAHGERNGTFNKYQNHHHPHHTNHHHSNHNNNHNNSNRGETKSTDTCFKCGLVGHWARECTSNGREFVRKPGRYERTDSYIREPYNARDNRDKYIRDERYPPPALPERGGYDRPYDRYGRDPPELEYRRDYRGNYDRTYERERDRPYDRTYPDREYERVGRDNYDRNYYGAPRDGYDRDGYDRRPLPPPDVTLYAGRGRGPNSPPPPPPPRRGSYERGIRDPPISSYRARSPLATSRYPDPLVGPPPLRPSSPRTGIYRRRSMSPIRGSRTNIPPYSGRQRSPSPVNRPLSSRRGPSTPTPPPTRR